MGVTVFYSGSLAEGKTVDAVVSHIEDLGRKEHLRTQRPMEISEGGNGVTFIYRIPQKVIDTPNGIHWIMNNRRRILRYAQDARLSTAGKSYDALCKALNSTVLTQIGVYIWVHKQSEPLRILFLEGGTELTELCDRDLPGKPGEEQIQYVEFVRESLSTKTAYEIDPKAHERALEILREVNDLYFGGKMRIRIPT